MQNFKQRYGPWALITGASAGLGELFAHRLAAQGLNLVLTARREDRLKALGQELEGEYGIQTRSIAVDFGSDQLLDTIQQRTQDLEIGLLVNNAGFTNSGDFLDNSLDKELLLVHVNIRAPMLLAHHFGQQMRQRGRGGMIFSASIAGFAPIPFWANYSASKSYDLFLAEALAEELKPRGVDVLALCPGATHTEFSTYTGFFAPLLAMQPEKVVDQALKRLGKRHTTVVGLLNFLTVMSYRFVPRRMSSWLAGLVIRDMVDD
jgi:short-subunit dehydrogenase